jgi:hypothetical protein
VPASYPGSRTDGIHSHVRDLVSHHLPGLASLPWLTNAASRFVKINSAISGQDGGRIFVPADQVLLAMSLAVANARPTNPVMTARVIVVPWSFPNFWADPVTAFIADSKP